mmetsp:Transcript_39294/g.78518  ORF Transcript_39294/g.78518 Transcript_39294/m.78518 type:complete len:125 (-) Transcript_39294:387-761(-)
MCALLQNRSLPTSTHPFPPVRNRVVGTSDVLNSAEREPLTPHLDKLEEYHRAGCMVVLEENKKAARRTGGAIEWVQAKPGREAIFFVYIVDSHKSDRIPTRRERLIVTNFPLEGETNLAARGAL